MDSALPRDRLVITPHFRDQGVTTDPDNLCQDMADGLNALDLVTTEIRVTAYDAESPAPSYPVGTGVANEGVVATSSLPREVALCFSFYSERNIPRQRGRVFWPMPVMGAFDLGLRPPEVTRQYVGEGLATLFSDLGGVDVDWVVWSRVDDEARPVSNWWVDDEWDTIRSRGLRATTRTTGTVNES
jgi:hypothetical protein